MSTKPQRASAIKASYMNNACYVQDLIYTVTKVTSNEYIIGGRTGGMCPPPFKLSGNEYMSSIWAIKHSHCV